MRDNNRLGVILFLQLIRGSPSADHVMSGREKPGGVGLWSASLLLPSTETSSLPSLVGSGLRDSRGQSVATKLSNGLLRPRIIGTYETFIIGRWQSDFIETVYGIRVDGWPFPKAKSPTLQARAPIDTLEHAPSEWLYSCKRAGAVALARSSVSNLGDAQGCKFRRRSPGWTPWYLNVALGLR